MSKASLPLKAEPTDPANPLDPVMERVAFMNHTTMDQLNAYREAHRSDVEFNHQKMLELLDRLDQYTK